MTQTGILTILAFAGITMITSGWILAMKSWREGHTFISTNVIISVFLMLTASIIEATVPQKELGTNSDTIWLAMMIYAGISCTIAISKNWFLCKKML